MLRAVQNGVFFAGAAIMVLTITYFADKWGRRAAIAVVRTIWIFQEFQVR